MSKVYGVHWVTEQDQLQSHRGSQQVTETLSLRLSISFHHSPEFAQAGEDSGSEALWEVLGLRVVLAEI